jgi:hypothetical protein
VIDYIRIGVESSLPEAVAENGDRVRAGGLIFFSRKEATDGGRDAEHVEIIAGDEIAIDALGRAVIAQAERRFSLSDESRKDIVAVTVIRIERI